MNKVLRITLAGEHELFADADLAACIREANRINAERGYTNGACVVELNEQFGARESLYREHGKGSIAQIHGYPPYFSWEEPQSSWASSWKPTHWQPLPSPPTE